MGSSSDLSCGVAHGPYGEAGDGASLPGAGGPALFSAAGLAGRWQVRRRIEDALAGGTATLTGEAVFTPDDGGLRYDEAGTLTLPGGQSFAASRRYLWRFGPVIEVRFGDGRLFHTLDPGAPETPVVHLCGADRYEGRYRITADGWQTEWRIRGPRKDQRTLIAYRR